MNSVLKFPIPDFRTPGHDLISSVYMPSVHISSINIPDGKIPGFFLPNFSIPGGPGVVLRTDPLTDFNNSFNSYFNPLESGFYSAANTVGSGINSLLGSMNLPHIF